MNWLARTLGVSAVAGMAAMGAFAVANAQDDAAAIAALMDDGADIYNSNCVGCHGAEGEGGEGPRLAEYERLQFISATVGQIIEGGAYMPAFGGRLDDDEVAAVATYIRNAWGNEFGLVTAENVAAYR